MAVAKSGMHAATTAKPVAPAPVESKAVREESRAAKAAADAKKASEASIKIEQDAIAKAATINQRLVRDGNPRRIGGGVRNGEPKFFWGNFVPVQELSEEELAAVEKI